MTACFRVHGESKTTKHNEICEREAALLCERHGREAYPKLMQKLAGAYFRRRDIWRERMTMFRQVLRLRTVPGSVAEFAL